MRTTDQNFIEMCPKIANLNNNGTLALQVIAEFFGYTKYINILNAVMSISEEEGFVPNLIGKYKNIMAMEMLEKIAREHGKDVYSKIMESL